MTVDILKDYIEQGREIEFDYNGKKYSVTYGLIDGKEMISFCEFYKETTEVTTAEDLLNVRRDGVSVRKMWESLKEDDPWIF